MDLGELDRDHCKSVSSLCWNLFSCCSLWASSLLAPEKFCFHETQKANGSMLVLCMRLWLNYTKSSICFVAGLNGFTWASYIYTCFSVSSSCCFYSMLVIYTLSKDKYTCFGCQSCSFKCNVFCNGWNDRFHLYITQRSITLYFIFVDVGLLNIKFSFCPYTFLDMSYF